MLLCCRMKSLIVLSALFLGACSHRSNDATTPSGSSTATSDTDTEPSVDPTLPSWAPPSCKRYHAAVVKLIDCEAVPQATRDAAKAKYDADHTRWQAMQQQPQGAIEEVRQSCADNAKAVRAQMIGTCQ
jgi:hypothetical protein